MKSITDGPNNNYEFGKIYDYAVWTAETNITLANVSWAADYKDVVQFPTGHAGLNAYLDNQPSMLSKTGMSRARFDMPIRIDVPFNRANRYNYVRASNPAQPVNPSVGGADIQRDYYYFITSVQELAPNTTQITVELDVFQTFGYDISLGNCYIERGHIGIANENNFTNYGRDHLTIPEGMDIGAEYVTAWVANEKVMTNSWGTEGLTQVIPSEPGYDVLVCSTTDLEADPGTIDNPKMNSAKGGTIQNMPSGASFYIFKGVGGFLRFMEAHTGHPWMTQGIISITAIPRINRYLTRFVYDDVITSAPKLGIPSRVHQMFPNWRNRTDGILSEIPERYRHLRKLFTYPYMLIEMTTWGGTPIIIKPETWSDPNATVNETVAIVPPNQRVVFNPMFINKRNTAPDPERKLSWMRPEDGTLPGIGEYATDLGLGEDNGEYQDLFTMITNFPTFPIVNNGAIGYMASNAHGIAFQTVSADWSQQRALQGASNANYQSQVGRAAETMQYEASRKLDSTTTHRAMQTATEGSLAVL
jgi:hypothetical protein